MKSRKVEKVSSLGQNIFLVSVDDEMRTSTVIQEDRLAELLAETAIGCLSFDPYEAKQARRMLGGGS